MGEWIPSEIFECNIVFIPITVVLVSMLNDLEAYEAAHKEATEDGTSCEPNEVDYKGLMSTLLRKMGEVSLLYPFDRAVYPLPSGDAIEVPLTGT